MEIKTDYWKSLDEKYQTPEFLKAVENEFLTSPLQQEDGKDGVARRQFIKLMGASLALTAAACVRRPVQKIIPYNKRPGEIIPDLPNFYASSWFDGSEGLNITVKTREGRPIYVTGLESSPLNGKGISARAGAHILSLYDPDRIKKPTINSVNPKNRRNSLSVGTTWDNADLRVANLLKEGSVALLTSSNPSPVSSELTHKFLVAFSGKRYTWDPLTTESVRKGQQLSYGTDAVPVYNFEKAEYVLSIDGDFLGTYLSPVKFSKEFNKARNPDQGMAKLVSFHSVPSLTSLNADDVFPIRASQQAGLACGLLVEVAKINGSSVAEAVKKAALTDEQLGFAAGTLKAVAKDLTKKAGKGIVIAGGLATETDNAVGLQVAVNALNSALGNEGKTIKAQGAARWRNGSSGDVLDLIKDIEAGKIKTLIVHDVNPIYAFPKGVPFEEAAQKLKGLISTTNWMDETGALCDVVAPCGHPMENWNEYEFSPGLKTIQQPTVRPLNDTRSFEDSLIAWAKAAGKSVTNEASYYEHLKAEVTKSVGSEKGWFDYLQAGFRGTVNESGSGRSLSSSAYSAIKVAAAPTDKDMMELVLYPTVQLGDGSLANVSWLQELPDPVTKVVWDNYLTVSPKYAEEKKLKMGSMVEIEVNGAKITAPVYIHPGQHPGVVGMAVGYGRTAGGELAKGVGINAFALATVSDNNIQYSNIPVKVTKTAGMYELAITQGHNSMEGRQIVVETSLKDYKAGQDPVHRHKVFSLWGEHKYEGHKWGMAVDLNSCTGCSACMVACQSENNIPVVGKKYVLQGREMHWIRIDRYYKGDEASPDAVFQPVMCQHCENAPCETVCPVLATVHSDEGLNDMVYNRCVGTRYCSNNCPYKVRRFNWFYYDGHHRKEPLHMALNPEVTVRTRGVMEKCTFCVQRIKDGKGIAKDENRPLKDGDIKTACEEACPTSAIAFGDLNDKTSAVAKAFEAQRQYTLLEEVNAAPRVRYMAKVRNTDREMGTPHHNTDHSDKHSDEHSNKEEHI
jgi:MoCo/4Fe-4S cofactor protein with predicted Tat translocation signal